MKTIKCIDATGFALITVGKDYEVVSESRDYYHIVNNGGVEKRYGKPRFEEVKAKTSKEKPEVTVVTEKKPKEKPVTVVCKLPKGDVVKYNETYTPIGESDDKSKWIFEIGGKKVELLKSRFTPSE